MMTIEPPRKGAMGMAFYQSKEYEILKKQWNPKEDILFACAGDMNSDGQFQPHYLLLTKTKVLVAQGPLSQTEKVYGGYIGKYKPAETVPTGEIVNEIPLEGIDRLSVRNFLAGGQIYIQKGEEEIPLFCVTGGYMPEIIRFTKLFEKVKKGEELTQEDVNEKENSEFCEKCGAPYLDRERKICPKCTDHRSLFVRTFSYFKPHKWKMLGVALLIIFSATFSVIMPYLSGAVYFDDVLGKKSTFTGVWSLAEGDFLLLLALVMGSFLLVRIATYITSIFQFALVGKIVPRVVRKIKEDVFSALRRLSLQFFTDRKTGPLMTRVLGDAGEVTGFFIDKFSISEISFIWRSS